MITIRYDDWYCEELFYAYINKYINLHELLTKLDYDQVEKQRELFNLLNLILTNNFPHYCFNMSCKEKLYFSNTYDYTKREFNFNLKKFIKIWIAPLNLHRFSDWHIKIPFYCCDCFKSKTKSTL
ncbi:MAG: hypothetical protein ACFFB4_07190 [Promethearchaeota archaeon]